MLSLSPGKAAAFNDILLHLIAAPPDRGYQNVLLPVPPAEAEDTTPNIDTPIEDSEDAPENTPENVSD
jgi:hypothetical protein